MHPGASPTGADLCRDNPNFYISIILGMIFLITW